MKTAHDPMEVYDGMTFVPRSVSKFHATDLQACLVFDCCSESQNNEQEFRYRRQDGGGDIQFKEFHMHNSILLEWIICSNRRFLSLPGARKWLSLTFSSFR